jgi:hypothetical protein
LLPAAIVEPTLRVAMTTWDAEYAALDALEVWDGEQLAQAVMGAYAAMLAGLLDHPAPRKVLVVGASLRPLPDGGSEIDGQPRRLAWSAIQSALLAVQELGIGVSFCHPDQLIPHCQMLLKRDRRPIVARRHIHSFGKRIAWLAEIAGIGEETARRVVEWCGGDLAAAWMALTDPAIPPPAGIAPGRWHNIQQRCRQWLGIPDGVRMVVEVIETIKTQEKT